MKYLLDTHTFLWATLETSKLSKTAKEIISKRSNEILVSTVTFWEITLKASIKKLSFEKVNIKDFPRYANEMGFIIRDLQELETITFHELPLKATHKDPFDRMLVWQAIVHDLVLISRDHSLKQYEENGLSMTW
ncbi:MAG: type II toxin-antitoxin system VapC family toxin [Spirochaetaceae bacterium]|jgi:PIN domain nuclease of toxin-antitoxin system|nr:type II toxin-antitoxin system VapC family toxin [Spirochaetaceae bacterium]